MNFRIVVSSETMFFPGKQMGRRRQVPFQLIMVDCDIDFFEVGVMVMEMMVTVNTDA